MTVPDISAFRGDVNAYSAVGDWKEFTIADGEKSTAEVDLGGEFPYLDLIFGTITATNFTVKRAMVSGGTMYQIGPDTNLLVVDDTNYSDMFNLQMARHVQLIGSAAQGAARTFYGRGVRP